MPSAKEELVHLVRAQPDDSSSEEIVRQLALRVGHGGLWPGQGLFPMLSYEDGFAAIDWLTRAFGFSERPGSRMVMPDESLGHVEMETGSGLIMLSTMGSGYESPKRHREHCERARRWSQVPWAING